MKFFGNWAILELQIEIQVQSRKAPPMKSRSIVHIALLLLLSLPVMATFAQDSCADVAGCSPTTGLPADVMAAYPEPNVNALPIKDSDLYDRIYKKMAGGAQIFDSPGGNLLETMGPGFTYITV